MCGSGLLVERSRELVDTSGENGDDCAIRCRGTATCIIFFF